jgi:tRNA-splicing ligase RtcB
MYSANHGAGRLLSRAQARKRQQPRNLMDALKHAGISVRTHSPQLLAEEAPLAYKDVDHVTDTACATGIARKVARLRPLICIKG